jgi:hypothetical protein
MATLIYFFIQLLVLICVFSLFYYIIQLIVGEIPVPAKSKVRAALLILLCLIAICCLLGSVGLWDAPWAFSHRPKW